MIQDSSVFHKKPKIAFFYGYVITGACFGTWFVGLGLPTTFSLFLKPVMAEFGWSRAETVLAYSLSLIIMSIIGITTGWLTDKLGPRTVLLAFGSFLGVSYVLMSFVDSLWQFQVNYALLSGIGLSSITAPVMATVSRWFILRRGIMMGVIQAGGGAGGLLFCPFASWLISSHGWRLAYLVLGSIALVTLIVFGLLLRRSPQDIGQLPDGLSPAEITDNHSHFTWPSPKNFSFLRAVHTPQFWIIAGLFSCVGYSRSTFLAHMAAYVQDIGFTLSDGALVVSVMTGATVISRIIMGRVADVIGNKPTYVISFLVTISGLGLGLIARDLWGLYTFAFIYGFGWGSQAVLRYSTASETFGLGSVGLLFGFMGLAEAFTGALGIYYAGYLFDQTQSYEAVFWTGIVICLIGLLLTLCLKTGSPHSSLTKPED